MPALTASKKDWYKTIFEIPWPKNAAGDAEDDAKASLVVEKIGTIDGHTVHLTVFRDAWRFRFRRDLDVDGIFDRVFGTGTGGIHVTLELDAPPQQPAAPQGQGAPPQQPPPQQPPPQQRPDVEPPATPADPPADKGVHCYLGGPNHGRTPEEQVTLQKLLDDHVKKYKAAIAKAKQDHDKFEWKDCDDPQKRFEFLFCDVKADGFERIATMVSESSKAHVVYPTQADSALVWAGASVHPLQMLQNTHQRLIRDEIRGLGQDAAREKESAGLGRYYYFQALTPQPLARRPDAPLTTEERMKEAEAMLSALGHFVETADLKILGELLDGVHKSLKSVRGSFFAVPKRDGEDEGALKLRREAHAKRAMAIPALAEMEKKMARAFKLLAGEPPPDGAQGAKKPPGRAEYERARVQLQKAHRDLGDALSGVCSVQNFHTIEPFYLFRLMARFQIRSEKAIPAGLRTKVSSAATGLLHNSRHMDWLFDWLRDKLVQLDARLKAACPTKGPASPKWPGGEPAFRFYLKGGRAAKYLEKVPKSGENDWDTNIIINPNLGAAAWYSTFVTIHNVVLAFLEDAKRDLTIEMYDAKHWASFLAALDEAQAAVEKAAQEKKEQADRAQAAHEAEQRKREAEEREREQRENNTVKAWAYWGLSAPFRLMGSLVTTVADKAVDLLIGDLDVLADILADEAMDGARAPALPPAKLEGFELKEVERESCKAELIDIGIPRRDTVEAFAQWYHVCPHIITCDDHIPIPGHLYYIAEYVLMIREAFMDRSISIGKTPKRVMRLLAVLEMDELDQHVAHELGEIPDSLKPSLAKADGLDKPRKRMMQILLAQFSVAYELKIDPDLAKCFDKLFVDNFDKMKAKAKYPKSLEDAIKAYGDEEAKKPANKQVPYEDKHKALADSIGYAQWISQAMDDHLRKERAAFMLEHKKELIRFASAIYTGAIYTVKELLEAKKTAPELALAIETRSIFAVDEELEVQLAISGAFAARLHCEYAKLETERLGSLEPLRRLDFTIYAHKGSDTKTVLELIEPLVDEYIKKPKTIHFVKKKTDDSLYLTWPEAKAFSSDFTYKPLVVKVTVAICDEGWPAVAFIRGLPVLGLRDLIWEYKRRAGYVEESFNQEALRVAVDALGDVLTRFENPSPGEAGPIPVEVAPLGAPDDPGPPPREPVVDAQPPAPLRRRRVADRLEMVGQQKGNWCWAAASLMMRKFYLRQVLSLEDVVKEAFGDERDAQHALRLDRLEPQGGVERRLLGWDGVKTFIENDKPFVVGNAGHYFVCYGYEEQGASHKLMLWDPMGAGRAVTKTYAEYEQGARYNDWATACDFKIKARRALVPIVVAAPHLVLGDGGSKVKVDIPAAFDLASVEASELRVRIPKNSIGGDGAVIHRQAANGLAASVEWTGTLSSTNARITSQDVGGNEVLVEIEATLRNDAALPPGATQAKIDLR